MGEADGPSVGAAVGDAAGAGVGADVATAICAIETAAMAGAAGPVLCIAAGEANGDGGEATPARATAPSVPDRAIPAGSKNASMNAVRRPIMPAAPSPTSGFCYSAFRSHRRSASGVAVQTKTTPQETFRPLP